MSIKSGVLTIKTTIGFTYTLDYKQDTSSWSILEQGIHFDSIGEALAWINTHEDSLEAYHNSINQD